MNNRAIVTFPYNLFYVEKVKIIKGHRLNPQDKYWSFPDKLDSIDLKEEGDNKKL